jgi:hypothetical protein
MRRSSRPRGETNVLCKLIDEMEVHPQSWLAAERDRLVSIRNNELCRFMVDDQIRLRAVLAAIRAKTLYDHEHKR